MHYQQSAYFFLQNTDILTSEGPDFCSQKHKHRVQWYTRHSSMISYSKNYGCVLLKSCSYMQLQSNSCYISDGIVLQLESAQQYLMMISLSWTLISQYPLACAPRSCLLCFLTIPSLIHNSLFISTI